MFEFRKLSNIIRIRYKVKISFKMPKRGRYTDKGSPPTIVKCNAKFYETKLSGKMQWTCCAQRNV